jgi:hypothetical protein
MSTKILSAVEAHVSMLGKKAKDRITGFAGVVSSVGFDLYGCIQAVLSPPVDKDGKSQDGRWFDVNRLEIVDETRVMRVPLYAHPATFAHGPAEKPAR